MTITICHSAETSHYIRHTIEPIAHLHAGDIMAVEVISFSEHKAVFSKADFNSMATPYATWLFTQQLAFFQALHKNDNGLYHTAFLSVDLTLMECFISWDDFSALISGFGLSMAFEMADIAGGISDVALSNMARLRQSGVKLWINNADESLLSMDHVSSALFDGIRVNKQFFWRSFTRCDDTAMTRLTAAWGHDNVILEGIENKHHLAFVKLHGYVQGQGFYWRAKLSRSLISSQ
ncbi:EAL domain-containing protein [Aeromonas eucrenophila]|uniref:EAL domain-containing protein n=1 Tax=Aeromonas eucrenophila TaxID=649 RepID=A0ABW0YCL1_9GAMM|nr:EAL domain-containing protein [Aeromonas eucrenophila]